MARRKREEERERKEKVERVSGNPRDRLLFELRISSSIPSEVIVIYRCLREERRVSMSSRPCSHRLERKKEGKEALLHRCDK